MYYCAQITLTHLWLQWALSPQFSHLNICQQQTRIGVVIWWEFFFLNLVRALSNHFTYFRPLPSSDNIIWYSAFSRSINFYFEFTFPLELCIIMPQLNWTIINDSYKNGIMYIRTEQQNNEKKMVSERKVGTKDEDAPHQAAGGTTTEKTENSSERCRRWWWRRMLSSKVDGGWFDMMYLYSIYVHACARHNLKQS